MLISKLPCNGLIILIFTKIVVYKRKLFTFIGINQAFYVFSLTN
jgi:hypothetical protein